MKRSYVFVLALFLAIGFASVATNFIQNGNILVKFDESDFKSNVVFTKAKTLTGTAIINGDEKNIDFASIKLEDINQKTILNFDVANKSREYDSSVTITCGLKDEFVSYNEYLDINMSLPSPFDLLAGETKSGEFAVTLKKAYDQALETSVELKCTLTATPIERESKGDEYVKPPYKDKVLNGADPVLDETSKLVPVKISSDGTVTAADTTEEWYNYTNKEWANAVILNDGATYTVGETIPEETIESYFVWIPKYKYQIFDMGNYATSAGNSLPSESIAKEIQIEFTLEETEDTDTSCVSPKIAGESGTCEVGKWITHPAFQNFDVTGLWVGKFEIGYKEAETKAEAEKNENNVSKVIIKPNAYSWRYNTVGNFFKISYDYKRKLDSHMMKNTEWGAVAYLSHSKYGINGEIRINNNSNMITGYASTDATNQSNYPGVTGITEDLTLPYNTETGYKASTTGNITGVYDLSGGAFEYVSASRGVGNSELTNDELTEYAKYIDTYPNSGTYTTYNNRILGDATGEIGPFYFFNGYYQNNWYADSPNFVDPTYSFFSRGGSYDYGLYAGQFAFNRYTGGVGRNDGARIVLAVK